MCGFKLSAIVFENFWFNPNETTRLWESQEIIIVYFFYLFALCTDKNKQTKNTKEVQQVDIYIYIYIYIVRLVLSPCYQWVSLQAAVHALHRETNIYKLFFPKT